jgi:nucleotidyltransferase/DNA polymerase involved in DNA repair
MIVCVRLPRFELVIAAGGPQALAGRPLALAPDAGREPRLGEVSGAAEAFGVRSGMLMGEGLARCPELILIPPDPLAVAEAWEGVLRALESIGASVELAQPGLAYFDADGLRGLHGGEQGVITAARQALDRPARLGAGPTRMCALAAALRARARRAAVVSGADAASARRYLAPLPVTLLRYRRETAPLVESLLRLGLNTLGELATLSRAAMTDRFGETGRLAHRLAQGEDSPLRPRRVQDCLQESLELPESASGPLLEQALGVLVDRLLARPERLGRTLRAAVLAARLASGGTWRERVVFREALSDPRRMRLALTPRLALLPAPADCLALSADSFGPPSSDQRALLDEARVMRRRRLQEAVRQVRTVAGPYGALRALCIDPDSRVPERRVMLTPFEG